MEASWRKVFMEEGKEANLETDIADENGFIKASNDQELKI